MFGPKSTVKFPVINYSLNIVLQEIPIKIMFLVLSGLATSVMWPNIFNLTTEGLGRYTAASGLFMNMVVGGGILPAIQGAIADSYGYMASYGLIIVSLSYILIFAYVGSKPRQD